MCKLKMTCYLLYEIVVYHFKYICFSNCSHYHFTFNVPYHYQYYSNFFDCLNVLSSFLTDLSDKLRTVCQCFKRSFLV